MEKLKVKFRGNFTMKGNYEVLEVLRDEFEC